MVLPFTLVLAGVCFRPEASSIALLIGTVLGGILAGWPVDRAVFPSFDFPKWMRACGVFSAIKLSWLFLFLFFALTMPNHWSPAQLGWTLAFLVVTTALSAGLMHRLLVAIRIIRPANERLRSLAMECAAEENVPMKSVWEIPSPSGFAAALVVQRALIFSTATAAEHDDDELRAICRHEIAHLTEGPLLVALRVVQVPVTLLPFIFIPTFFTALGGPGILPPLLIWWVLHRCFARISLHLEKRADKAARRDADSPVYARALERLHRRNLAPAVLAPNASRTHPDLYDRMVAAGFTPDYPRPKPPEGFHWLQVTSMILSGISMIAWMARME